MHCSEPVRIAVFGAGLVGERHARLVSQRDDTVLDGIVDPSPKAKLLAADLAVPYHREVTAFLSERGDCDGVIIATPNHTHSELARSCIDKGIPCLVEKPLAANSREAESVVEASQGAGVPVLVGHHRRHHQKTRALKNVIDGGTLGRIVGAQLSWVLKKPADYFDADWRTQPGGGPVWINFIHEIDLLRYLLGEAVAVSAMLSNAARGNLVEDTGVVSIRFENQVLVSATLSDTAASPWHFEGGSGENPNISLTGQDGLRVFGSKGSISFPSMRFWHYGKQDGHWGVPISSETIQVSASMDGEAALSSQLDNFVGVIQGRDSPLVSAQDGLQAVRIIETIHLSARSGSVETVPPPLSAHPSISDQPFTQKRTRGQK